MTHDDTRTGVEEERHGRGRLLLALAFVILVLAALYVAVAAYFGDRVPGETRVEGIAIGGMTQSEARTALRGELADDAAEPVVVTVGDEERTFDPSGAGLSLDYRESIADLYGFSLDPVDLWAQATGGVDRDIAVDVDEEELAAAVKEATTDLDKKPVEGTVSLEGTKVVATASRPGRSLDREELVGTIATEWPAQHEFDAPTSTIKPELSQLAIETFVSGELKPLVSGPVTVTSTDPEADGDTEISFTVPTKQLAEAVSVSSEKGKLTATVDKEKAAKAAMAAADSSGLFPEAKDAKVVQSGSGFDVTSSSTGLALATKGLGTKVVEAMGQEGDERVVTVSSTTTQPELTTKEAKSTLPKDVISSFTTHLPDNPVRTANIALAARTLNGTYVPPGETFSLNERLGERTPGKGYKQAGVIYNGRLAKDYGGGISQLSTTLFNAAFFSGTEILEFHPHSFYISRYPEGREATISWPNVDNAFRNTTGAGILINASVSGNEVTVTFHGRDKYDEVTADKSPRRDIVTPKTIKDDSEDCVPQGPTEGFTVDITRTLVDDGSAVDSWSFTTVYDAADHIICTG